MIYCAGCTEALLQILALSAFTYVRGGRLASAPGTCGGALGAGMYFSLTPSRGERMTCMGGIGAPGDQDHRTT